jgi:5-methylcytosine-specific restriction endonuclease McrA
LRPVLLLNASYEPLHLCSWKRAISLICRGKAVSVEDDTTKPLGYGYHLPIVIRLLNYIKSPYRETPLTRRNVMHRDSHQCQYCGQNGIYLTLDHVLPRSRGGKHDWLNVVAACSPCNLKKGCHTPEEAKMPLLKPPYRPPNAFIFEISKHGALLEDFLRLYSG